MPTGTTVFYFVQNMHQLTKVLLKWTISFTFSQGYKLVNIVNVKLANKPKHESWSK